MSLPKFNIRVPLNIIVCSNLHPPNLGGSGANLYEGQQLGEQGYADHGEEGGDECDLGHEGGVALVFQAEVATGMAMTSVLMFTTKGVKPSADVRQCTPRGRSARRKTVVA